MKPQTANPIAYSRLLPILFSFFVMGFVDIVSISVSYVKSDFGLKDTIANFLPMMVFIWFAVCSIPTGLMMRRLGRRHTVMISAVVTFAGMVLPFISYSYQTMLMAFALLGIGNTILQVSLNPLVSDVVDTSRLTSTLTFGQFVKAISSAAGPVMVAFMASFFGNWKLIFAVYAVLTAISFVWLLCTSIPEKKQDGNHSGFKVVMTLLRDKYILLLFSVILFIVGFEVSLMTAVPKFFVEKGLTLEDGSYANTLYFIARTAGTFLGARTVILPMQIQLSPWQNHLLGHDMTVKQVDARSLALNQGEILLAMGASCDSILDDATLALIEEIEEELLSIAKPVYCYEIVGRIDFNYGKIIAEALKEGSRYAILVATAGCEVDDLLDAYKKKDMVLAFIADAIASEMAESTSRSAIQDISTTLLPLENISNPYSPGYCGWRLEEQGKLFSCFPEAPCGVRLNDSFLMQPIKSVSCVLAIGENVVRQPYGCEICTKTDCYRKKP